MSATIIHPARRSAASFHCAQHGMSAPIRRATARSGRPSRGAAARTNGAPPLIYVTGPDLKSIFI